MNWIKCYFPEEYGTHIVQIPEQNKPFLFLTKTGYIFSGKFLGMSNPNLSPLKEDEISVPIFMSNNNEYFSSYPQMSHGVTHYMNKPEDPND